ncbi:phage holin family protein [Enterococcus sp. AZ102]|uniref:phage holin family protein n=1 Tax=Enterococcus sp. AZ102 TaxID=2774865 RepID=UPI003F2302D7
MIINNTALLNEFKNLLSNVYIQIFLWAVFIDIVTGLAKAFTGKSAHSTKGLQGLIKHLLVVILVTIAYPYLKILGLESFATAFVWFYVAIYGISIVENLDQLGIKVPNFVKQRLEKIKDDTEDKS